MNRETNYFTNSKKRTYEEMNVSFQNLLEEKEKWLDTREKWLNDREKRLEDREKRFDERELKVCEREKEIVKKNVIFKKTISSNIGTLEQVADKNKLSDFLLECLTEGHSICSWRDDDENEKIVNDKRKILNKILSDDLEHIVYYGPPLQLNSSNDEKYSSDKVAITNKGKIFFKKVDIDNVYGLKCSYHHVDFELIVNSKKKLILLLSLTHQTMTTNKNNNLNIDGGLDTSKDNNYKFPDNYINYLEKKFE